MRARDSIAHSAVSSRKVVLPRLHGVAARRGKGVGRPGCPGLRAGSPTTSFRRSALSFHFDPFGFFR